MASNFGRRIDIEERLEGTERFDQTPPHGDALRMANPSPPSGPIEEFSKLPIMLGT
jgi:hypothetical protein